MNVPCRREFSIRHAGLTPKRISRSTRLLRDTIPRLPRFWNHFSPSVKDLCWVVFPIRVSSGPFAFRSHQVIASFSKILHCQDVPLGEKLLAKQLFLCKRQTEFVLPRAMDGNWDVGSC